MAAALRRRLARCSRRAGHAPGPLCPMDGMFSIGRSLLSLQAASKSRVRSTTPASICRSFEGAPFSIRWSQVEQEEPSDAGASKTSSWCDGTAPYRAEKASAGNMAIGVGLEGSLFTIYVGKNVFQGKLKVRD